MMQLTVLGRNGPFPPPDGATSGYLVRSGEDAVQLDLGSGTLQALTKRMAPEDLTALVFSHWHHDHCSDALPLLYRLQAAGAVLDVFGPADDGSPVRQALRNDPGVRLHDIAPGDSLRLGGFCLDVFAARHPVPSVMLRLRDRERTLCYTGDTNTVDGLRAFAEGCDLLLADGLFPEAAWTEARPHLSAALCAELARDAGARRLVITHLNPFFDPQTLLREARRAYPAVELAEEGRTWTF